MENKVKLVATVFEGVIGSIAAFRAIDCVYSIEEDDTTSTAIRKSTEAALNMAIYCCCFATVLKD